MQACTGLGNNYSNNKHKLERIQGLTVEKIQISSSVPLSEEVYFQFRVLLGLLKGWLPLLWAWDPLGYVGESPTVPKPRERLESASKWLRNDWKNQIWTVNGSQSASRPELLKLADRIWSLQLWIESDQVVDLKQVRSWIWIGSKLDLCDLYWLPLIAGGVGEAWRLSLVEGG